MQKVKRKSTDNDGSPQKKKKVTFTGPKVENKKKSDLKVKDGKVNFDKDKTKTFKKFNKNDLKNKNLTKKKPLTSQSEGEKPKWSEMKKEKKTLRTERRKAKATAEIFEISHKAKLLAAQIQR